ncbi:EcsC family protein [Thalassobacillus devorans]|uniref:EcsC family protein n=1 Tax=Thalassobacillus devorans TaxID=279813 RepID=UPI0004B08281|nr:EcsC family protein [Thalassobacillus devorans]
MSDGSKVSRDIQQWRRNHTDYQPNDFERMYDAWVNQMFDGIDSKWKQRFFRNLDNYLFHTHAFIQGTSFQNEARERIVTVGRVFDNQIENISDLKGLSIDRRTYIAQQQISRIRLYSFAQGGLTGTGGLLLFGLDFPLMMGMNLRAVQMIGLSFGHEMNHPYEMMLSLRVFHAATLPKRMQEEAWESMVEEVRNNKHPYVFEGADDLTDESWLEQPLKQILKSLFIVMFRKKLIQGLPLVSMTVGATVNYRLTRRVSEFALRFYQYRYLLAKEEEGEDVR